MVLSCAKGEWKMGWFSSSIKCPRCQQAMDKNAKFCPKCGAAQGVQCRECGAAITPGARFCPRCGRDVGEQPTPTGEALRENHWARLPDVFAQRIEGEDLAHLARKGLHRDQLVVEPGVKAMIFQKGHYLGVLSQGVYPLETLSQRHLPTLFDSGVPTTAILVEEGDLEIRLNFEGVSAADWREVRAELALLLQVKDPEALMTHLLRGRMQMSVRDLRGFLEQEVRGVVAGYTGGHAGEDFTPGSPMRQKVEDELRQEMGGSLARWGLELIRVRVANFTCPELEQGLRKPEARLALAEEKQALEERAAALEQRAREIQNKDFIHKFQTTQDLKDYVAQVEHETGLKNLLRREEAQQAQDDFDRNEMTRVHALQRLGLELQTEVERLKRKAAGEFDEEEFERKARLERMTLEQRLSRERLQFIEEREQAMTLQADSRARKLADAKTEAEIAALEREKDQADSELSLIMLEKVKEIKRREQREQMILELEGEERRQRLRLEQERAQTQLKREFLETASKASLEALLATAEGAGGERLARHAQSQTQAGMSPEQLLALAAGQSPEAARALAEKFKSEGLSQSQQAALLQQMLERQERQRIEEADRIERLSGRAMDQLGAAAQAGAARPDAPRMMPAPQPAPPPPSPQPALGQQPVKKVIICPKCELENPVGSQYCQFCGAKL